MNYLTPKSQLSHGSLDVRTPDKLIDGVNDTSDPKHMWLAPILPGCVNKLFVVFDRPVALSMLKLWNYSKSSSRGVKDFSLLVDDLLIHSGTLPAAPSGAVARGILPRMSDAVAVSNRHRTVLFDRRNAALLAMEKGHIVGYSAAGGSGGGAGGCGGGAGQDVVLIDHSDAGPAQGANQKFRPMTSVKGRAQVAS